MSWPQTTGSYHTASSGAPATATIHRRIHFDMYRTGVVLCIFSVLLARGRAASQGRKTVAGSQESIIPDLTKDITEGLRNTIDSFNGTLDLCRWGINNIEDEALSGLDNLIVLKLSFNKIQRIKYYTFYGCSKLKALYLDDNGLTTLDDCFSHLGKLEVLYLQRNNLKTIPALPRLIKTLDISSNQISDLTLKFQQSMVKVDLCGNPITTIPAKSFENTANLESLCTPTLRVEQKRSTDTTSASVTSLPAVRNLTLVAQTIDEPLLDENIEQIRQMRELTQLTIDGFRISSPDFLKELYLTQLGLTEVTLMEGQETETHFLEAMTKMDTLHVLYLTGSSRVASILLGDEHIWTKLNKLSFVGLQHCNVTTLGKLENHNDEPLRVDISENPLDCTCELTEKFKRNLQLDGDKSNTICNNPDIHRGNRLLDVLSQQLCPNGNDREKENDAEAGRGDTAPPVHPEDVSGKAEPERDHPSPEYIDDANASDSEGTSPKAYIIVGVIFGLAIVGSVVFAVLFFYFRRRGHGPIDEGNVQFKSRDNLVDSPKKSKK